MSRYDWAFCFIVLGFVVGLLTASPETTPGEPPDTLAGDVDSLQIQIRVKDLERLKASVPFELDGWRVWRVKQLSQFGDQTPGEWWAYVRLDMVLLPDS